MVKFEPLTKAGKGYSFWLGRLLIDFNWARDLLWAEDNQSKTKRNTYYFSIHKIQKKTIIDHKIVILSALSIIIGPIKILFGVKSLDKQ